jgi:predicted SAM-dependent methyltransferase
MEKGYINVDLCPPADKLCDLREVWPWPDSSVEEIKAHDIFEHLPDKIHTLNEAYRVLRSGGLLDLIVPTTDGRGAWQDPTHCSYWNENSLFYAEYNNPHNTRFRAAYGMRHQFLILSKRTVEYADFVWKLHAQLRAIK